MKNKKYLVGLIILVVIVLAAILLLKDRWRVIDLRWSMPKGSFKEVSIVQLGDDGEVIYTYLSYVPDVQKFEEGFRRCVEKAREDAEKGKFAVSSIMKDVQLRIVTDKGEYWIYLIWTDDYVCFNRLRSDEFRDVLADAGLKRRN